MGHLFPMAAALEVCAKCRRKSMVDDVDSEASLIPRRCHLGSPALDGRIDTGTLPMSVENEERAGCVTAS